MYSISNDRLTVCVSEHGAELTSIRNAEGHEYLWCADPTYWKRHAPVLFPIVGSVWQGVYRSHGQEYALSQHGFARDMDFVLVSQQDTEIWFRLEDNEQTLAKYPYRFCLEIGYKLEDDTVEVIWRVRNTGAEPMAFQIGGHPAFYWPEKHLADSPLLGYFRFDTDEKTLTRSVITEAGCVGAEAKVELEEAGYLPLTYEQFAKDAMVLEHSQVSRVTLCHDDKTPYMEVVSSSPLMGLWTPPGKQAPFICIEPWWGRTDRAHYAGDYEHREWMQHLNPDAAFEGGYSISIL